MAVGGHVDQGAAPVGVSKTQQNSKGPQIVTIGTSSMIKTCLAVRCANSQASTSRALRFRRLLMRARSRRYTVYGAVAMRGNAFQIGRAHV